MKLKGPVSEVQLDLRNEKINYKIRDHSLLKFLFLIICGKKEMEEKSVTIRNLAVKIKEK